MTAFTNIEIERSAHPVPAEKRAEILAKPGFGVTFSDHMFTATWTPEAGWHEPRVRPYGPFQLDPATAVLHYAQEIFEGLKAYRHEDGSIWMFRPEANAARFRRSAARMALPELPEDDFVTALDTLVGVDREWIPSGGEMSLYVRPFMFASDKFLGVRPAHEVTFCVITSPAGSYFPSGVKPVNIWLSEEFTRAGRGGTGDAKTGGNYASSLLPQREAIEHGCDQVAFLDASEGRYVEELGGMNLFFVYADGHVVTPALGTILDGITRDSVITIAESQGMPVEQRQITIDEWRDGVDSGEITEVFACGTAAVVTPVGSLRWPGGEVRAVDNEPGKVTTSIRSALLDVQYGRVSDEHGWMYQIH
ncbi:MAG: branched-chain amino acid aminotransferase [Propionibacteriales bacterium]|nr:branched-chain amino acid aminotransferase [Propionibacteriales bacterium]